MHVTNVSIIEKRDFAIGDGAVCTAYKMVGDIHGNPASQARVFVDAFKCEVILPHDARFEKQVGDELEFTNIPGEVAP